MAAEGARTIAITGASGFIGSALAARLEGEGKRVLRLVRRPGRGGAGEVAWDPERGTIDAPALEGVDAVVHLAGESIDGRWTDERKRRLHDSRVKGTTLLARTLAGLTRSPGVLVSGSAIGIYGSDRGDETLTETSAPGRDFLGKLGVAWEGAATPALSAGIRVVHPRFGVVLGRDGGALRRMLPAFRMGVGGRMGSGQQWMSWISREDAVRVISYLIDRGDLAGPVNAVAPEPVRNSMFTEELGRALHRPTLLAVPRPALLALFGEMADGTILANQRVYPERLLAAGFEFRHPRIDQAFADIFSAAA